MTTEPRPLAIARGELGTHEISGPTSNSRVIEYAKVATGIASPDSEAWCARFHAWSHIKGGTPEALLPPPAQRSLARNWLKYGHIVREADVLPGDSVIFERGGAKSIFGHIAFVLRVERDFVVVIGGNQSMKGTEGAVTMARYPKSRVLGYRRFYAVAPAIEEKSDEAAQPVAPPSPPKPQPDPALKQVQLRLKALGYHEVGTPDGFPGTRTRGAILAFKADWNERHPDRTLPMDASTGEETLAALMAAEPRQISVERETAPESKIGDYAAVKEAKKVGLIGKITAWGGAAWVAVQSGVADQIASASYALQSVRDAVLPLWPVIKPLLPFLIVGGAVAVVIWVRRIRKEEIESHRMGETP